MNMERLDIRFDTGSFVGFWTLGFPFSGYVKRLFAAIVKIIHTFVEGNSGLECVGSHCIVAEGICTVSVGLGDGVLERLRDWSLGACAAGLPSALLDLTFQFQTKVLLNALGCRFVAFRVIFQNRSTIQSPKPRSNRSQ